MTLSRKNRLRTNADIIAVMRQGKRTSDQGIKAYFKKNSKGALWRAAVIIPKKTAKPATVRNRLKRQTSEIIKKFASEWKEAYDVVIVFQKGAENLTFNELKQKISRLLTSNF